MNKLCDFSVSVVICASLGAFACLYRINPAYLTVAMLIYPVICMISRKTNVCKVGKLVTCVPALISSSFSIFLSCKLINASVTLKSVGFWSVFVITVFGFAVLSLCSVSGLRMTSLCAVSISTVFLLLVFFLAILDTGFEFPRLVNNCDLDFLPFAVVTATDYFILGRYYNQNKTASAFGSFSFSAYFLLSLITAVMVLSADLYETIETPLIFFWSSTYIPSFVNKFETFAICSVFSLLLIKGALAIKLVTDVIGKKYLSVALSASIFVFLICLYFGFGPLFFSIISSVFVVCACIRESVLK